MQTDPKLMTREENDYWFFYINAQLLKLTYEGGQLEKKCELIEKRMKLKCPEDLIKRNGFNPDMELDYKNTLPKWWYDTLKTAQGRKFDEEKSRPDEFQ